MSISRSERDVRMAGSADGLEVYWGSGFMDFCGDGISWVLGGGGVELGEGVRMLSCEIPDVSNGSNESERDACGGLEGVLVTEVPTSTSLSSISDSEDSSSV